MARRHFNQVETAEFFGWYESVISHYLSGARIPNLTNAVKIEELTGIPAAAWVSSADDESDSAPASLPAKRRLHRA
jgi:hypothetical protein